MKFLFCILLLTALSGTGVNALGKTDSSRAGTRFVCAGFSAVAYKGSLQNSYLRWTPAYQAGIVLEKRRLFSSCICIGTGSYTGEDRSYRLPSKADQNLQPSASFEGRFFTLQYEARFLLFRYQAFSIQATQGLGIFRFSVSDRNGNSLSVRPKTRASGESYSQNSFFFPSAIMLSCRFPNRMCLSFQAGWYNTSSRYLDNMDRLSLNQNADNLASMRFLFSIPLK